MPTLHRSARQPTFRSRRGRQGFSLVELLVGLAIGLIIIAALLLLFANASSTGQNLARSSAQIENGRYVSELLREDIRLAGFFGEMPDSATLPDYEDHDPCELPTPTATPFVTYLPLPVQGIVPKDGANPGPTCLSNRKYGTSAVVVRRLSTNTTPTDSVNDADHQHYVQYSFCANPSATLVFHWRKAAFTLKNFACSATNPVRAYVSRVYYIADCNRCAGAGADTTPTLKRVDLVGNALVVTALAEGVETLRFEYGFDTNGDGVPDDHDGAGALTGTYLTDDNSPGTGEKAKWKNVMSLKAHFIVRSLERVSGAQAASQSFQLGAAGAPTITPNDGFVRRAYSTTIRLNNPSGARESP